MKLGQLFILRLRRISIFAATAISLLFFTSCNSEKAEVADIILAASELGPCDEDDSVDFPLQSSYFANGDIDYVTTLETGQYQSSDCLCEVANFLFVFEGVDPDWEIVIYDSDFNIFEDYDIAIDANGFAYILLTNPDNLPDENLTMLFDFDAGGTDPKPTLVQAGGLCIIENVVGTGGWPLSLDDPFKVIPPHSPGPGPRDPVRVYIPTSIGGTPY